MNITLRKAAPATEHPSEASPRAARSRWTRRIAAAATVTIAVAASGVAIAAWNVGGSGTGAATAAEAASLNNISFALDEETLLYPGFKGDGTLTVTNPNPFPVVITAITFTGSESSAAECSVSHDGSAADVMFLDQADTEFVLAANSGAVSIVLEDVIEMAVLAADECQNQTFDATVGLAAASTNLAVNTGD